MKTSARFLAMLLAVVMIASAALSVSAFSDVTGAVEHATAINVLAQLGVIGGYEDGTFKPDQNVTRAEMAKLVYVLYTTFTDAGAGAVKFDDVKADNWAAGYISWCASKNIIGGYGDGKFGPNDNVTYDQALKMVAGTLGYNEWDSAQWPTDVRMKALNDLKLGEDIPATVKGNDKLTRAQVAQIMYNALDADMKETKNESVELIKDSGIMVNVPVAKKLAVDVWKFEKVTYTVESYTTKDSKTEITLAWEEDDDKKTETFKLADLGLEAYEGKASDLVGLDLVGLVKNEERLGNPSVLGTIKDGVAISFPESRKSITIDGVKYDAEDFEEDAKYPIAITVNGKAVEVVFDDEAELTNAVATNLMPNKQYLARTTDFNGDGHIDAVAIVEKVGYVVNKVKTTKGVTTVTLKSLDEKTTKDVNAANLSITVEEGDVVVAATLGATTYAEKVEGKETYATKLSTGDRKVTLNEVGVVKYGKLTLAGVAEATISTDDLGKDNADVYYIYNGEIIKKETAKTASDYSFAILRDVVELDPEFNDTTKEFVTGYVANIYVVEEGKLTLKKLPLDPKDGEELFDIYEIDSKEVNGKKLAVYNYALVTSYTENKDGYYELDFDAVGTSEDYIVIDANNYIEYNTDTEYYTIGGEDKIRANENTVFFYTAEIEDGAAKGFVDVNFYTKTTITKNEFADAVLTKGVSVIYKNEAGRKFLLATFVEGEIEGSVGDTVISYKNDGTLVLFAPASSETELVDGKLYNSYTFMDNATLTIKEPVLDTNKEYEDAKSTVAGGLYGYDAKNGIYVQITAETAPATVVASTLLDVIAEDEIIDFMDGDKKVTKKVASDVTIWGLGESDKEVEIVKLTLEELEEMFTLVKENNEEENKEQAIEIIVLKKIETVNGNNVETIKSIIVEIYEADKDDDTIVTSVNETIFDTFKA